jgi:2-polyprenyl-6-methoxyphenol hydroxylase-like FAD-dependent oxidoreductase
MAASTRIDQDTLTARGGGGGHAVVVGGSMAGLLAARVLAGHVDRVTVVERDLLPEEAGHRKGVPQSRQLHVLLARGLGVLDRFFPGFSEDLSRAGAVSLRVPGDLALLAPFGWMDRRAPGWTGLSAGRPLMEAVVRRHLGRIPGVTVRTGCEVTDVVGSRDGRAVTGVTVRQLDSGESTRLDADLVVDASGRGSRAATWLTGLGYPQPERSDVDPDIAYATQVVRIPDGFTADWKAVMLTSQPPTMPRTGYLFPIEGGQWMVSAMGAAGQHPPTDPEGFTAFLRSLRHPVIADAVERAEPVTPARAHRGTANRRWHFERMPRWPERFLVTGDAVCAFNPIYGQGMTTAAIAAETLDACLAEHRRRHPAGDLDGVARRFQRRLARAGADPWALSTGEDLRFPSTSGTAVTRTTRLQHRYLDRVVAAATEDPRVADVYLRVLGMLEPSSAVFRPHVVAAALRARPDPDHLTGVPPVTRPAPSPLIGADA